MNRKDFRPLVLGGAAGAAAFAGLIAWVEYDPWDIVAQHWARRRLTPAERAELDRINAEEAARNRSYMATLAEGERKREAWDTEVRNGFRPGLLNVPRPVTTVDELTLSELVAEIERAEKSSRGGDHEWYLHREALHLEFTTSRNSWQARARAPRADQLRLDIAAAQIKRAREAATPAFEDCPDRLVEAAVGGELTAGQPVSSHTYPIFEGPGAEAFGDPTTTKE